MNKNIINVILGALLSIGLMSCSVSPQVKDAWNNKYKPINTIPMYGYPTITKTKKQEEADEEFIRSVTLEFGSREKASKNFSIWGWTEHTKGNYAEAMKRFNQSWLLDKNYYQPYWGFGAIALVKNKPSEAFPYFEKSLKLIDDEKERPKLLVETARSYAWEGHVLKSINQPIEAEKFLNKAISLIDESLKLDPKNGRAYYFGVQAYRSQGNYKKAWEMVEKARKEANYEFDEKLITTLTKEMSKQK